MLVDFFFSGPPPKKPRSEEITSASLHWVSLVWGCAPSRLSGVRLFLVYGLDWQHTMFKSMSWGMVAGHVLA